MVGEDELLKQYIKHMDDPKTPNQLDRSGLKAIVSYVNHKEAEIVKKVYCEGIEAGRVAGKPQLGETGEFPRGQLNKDDEGELRMAIGAKDNNVIINFGKNISWLGLDKNSVLALGRSITMKAQLLK